MKQLIHPQPQNLQDLEIELRQRTFREMLDQIVELALPSQRAGDQIRRQRAIALILKCGADSGKGCGQIGAAGIYIAKRGERRRSRGRDHDAIREDTNLAPGSMRLPARNSRAVTGRRPSRWSISSRTMPPPA